MFLLNHLWIILALPLLGSAINGLFGKKFPQSAVNSVAVGLAIVIMLAQNRQSLNVERVNLLKL